MSDNIERAGQALFDELKSREEMLAMLPYADEATRAFWRLSPREAAKVVLDTYFALEASDE